MISCVEEIGGSVLEIMIAKICDETRGPLWMAYLLPLHAKKETQESIRDADPLTICRLRHDLISAKFGRGIFLSGQPIAFVEETQICFQYDQHIYGMRTSFCKKLCHFLNACLLNHKKQEARNTLLQI